MATYEEVLAMCKELYAKQHPESRHGPGVAPCHIAHAKELLGMPKRPRTSPNPRKKPCPPEKLPLIRQAFIALGMLPPENGRKDPPAAFPASPPRSARLARNGAD